MSIDIGVNDSNAAFNADDDDDDNSNKTNYKTNKIRADNVNVNIIKDDSYTEKCNNYYDNIDDEILQTEYEGTLVFEEDSLALTSVRTTNANDTIIRDVSTTVQVNTTKLLHTVVDYLDEKTLEYIYGMLLEHPYDDDTRETAHQILMEALSAQDDITVDRLVVCESLFALLDMDKQQQQSDTTSANNLPIVISTNIEIQPPTTSTPTNTHK